MRGVVRYNKTNMTCLWVCQHDSLPLVSIVTLGLRPRVTMLTRGRQSCWQTHRHVIFVYYITKRYILLLLFWGKVPLTCGNYSSLHMVAMATRKVIEQVTLKTQNTKYSPGSTVWQNNNVCPLLWQYAIFLYVQFMGKVHLIHEKTALSKRCLHMVAMTQRKGNKRWQRTRVEN